MSDSKAKRNIEAVYPLSPMQQGMLFHSLYAPESGAYFEQFSCVLRGDLDLLAFETAWREVVKRQSVLRTAFVWKRLDRMLQVVQKDVELPIERQDWRGGDSPLEDKLQAYLEADRARGFDLAKAPLMRLGLFRIADDAHYFVWSHHHALMDGWSMPLLLKEVLTYYDGFCQEKSIYLVPPRPYRDYITWLQEQDASIAEVYWRKLLEGIHAPTPLVVDHPNVERRHAGRSQEVHNHEQEIYLSKESTATLSALARRERLTLSTMIQAAWALLLWRYSGEQKVLFGATVSGRPTELAGAETMIGLFINTLPICVSCQPQEYLANWLQRIQQQSIETRQFEYSALVQIQDWSEIPPGFSLFESILVFENYPVEETLQKSMIAGQGLAIEQVRSYEQTNYPLTIVSGPGEKLGIKISYDPTRFDMKPITRVLGHLCTILESMISGFDLPDFSQRRLNDISLLTTAEENQILDDFVNQLAIPAGQIPEVRQDVPIHQLFEEQARLTPQAIAIVLDDPGQLNPNEQSGTLAEPASIPYGELNERADLLAVTLRRLGLGPDMLVGLYVERSLEMVVGILGILKAGGAYVPLDPNYPLERIAFMLEDTQAQVVLTQSHLKETLVTTIDGLQSANSGRPHKPQVITLDTEWEQIKDLPENGTVAIGRNDQADRNSLAYVIYTSGSTGKPKGVMIEHHSLVNLATNYAAITALGPEDRVLQFISLGFDASAEEIFPSLIRGATLVLPRSSRELTTADFIHLVERQAITVLHLPVAFWHRCVEDMQASLAFPGGQLTVPASVKVLVVGGESPSIEKLRNWIELSGENPGMFINAYGPTESTIAASYYKIALQKKWSIDLERLPIGRGLANNQIFILDPQLQPVPIGVPGEICVGGAGVARGYLNHPEITAEKFIQVPANLVADNPEGDLASPVEKSKSRIYRTGDLARFLPDGNIEFLGRVDQQVKIRGFRIELGEIETVLEQHPLIKSAAVLARQDSPTGDRRLVAYVVPVGVDVSQSDFTKEFPEHRLSPAMLPAAILDRPIESPSPSELRRYLNDNLPDYMVPAVIVMLEDMPLTPNGKIDRHALPLPDGEATVLDNVYVAPRTPVETLLVGSWEQILGSPRIGIFDNFFELGGHSLIATQVISRIRNVFQVEISLRELFESPTVASLAEQIEKSMRADAGTAQTPILPVPRSVENGLPLEPPQLSFSQQRLWFLDQLAPGNLFYNIPLAVEIDGELDAVALKKTLDEIIARHAILRTNFKSVGGVPLQIVRAELVIDLPVVDLTLLSEEARMTEAVRMAHEEAQVAFNLENDPLIRARLLYLGRDPLNGFDRHVFLLSMHHIVSDGWSMGVFLNEVGSLYGAFSSGKPSSLPDLKVQYFDYANWQRNWLQGEQLERQLGYWKNQLANQPRILDLPTDRPRPAVQSSRGATQAFHIPLALAVKIIEMSRQEGATVYMTLLAVFQILLARYSGQDDISIGTAIANRNKSEIESLIGFFVNTLVLRTDLSGEPTFKELLKRVRDVSLGAYAHQDLPFEMLVEALQPDRDLSHTPLFQVAFALQNAPLADTMRIGLADRAKIQNPANNLAFKLIEVDSGSAKFDLTLTLAETTDGLVGGIEYNLDLFNPETIHRMVNHFSVLLENIVADPDQLITQVAMLSPAERQVLLVDWNQTEMETPVHRCAHELFEAWARQTPETVAVRFENQVITYQELNRQADQLANYLRTSGVRPDTLVGISTERSLHMVIGILGVMKAGGAYVPLDPTYPTERLAYMIQDSQVSVLLTQERLLGGLPVRKDAVSATGPLVLCLDTGWDVVEKSPQVEMGITTGPDNLAYMIYTSGSTGRPKGTMLRHRGLCNLAEAQRQAFNITSNSRILQFSPLSFDASVWETFMALANGATLILARQDTLGSAPDLLNLLREQQVTTVTLPPSVLRLYSVEQVSTKALPALRTVISAGEACTPDLVAIWGAGRDFFNAYGPTETTVCATMYRCNGSEVEQPPIGKPIANTKTYILDRYLQPVPLGVNGELHVSGISLAAGYYNQPEMTAVKFIENPFLVLPDFYEGGKREIVRMYKTGDLARYRSDGNIEYLGRIDQQVKVRGFRIELGEIETALGKYPRVKEAVVVAQELDPGEKRLAAFLVIHPEMDFEISDLRGFLRQTLPDYMLPSSIMVLDEFPLTPSGKVDRKALADLQALERPELTNDYIAPRDPVEERLVEICRELLHLEKVGINDNFFELGGHSLLATQFVSRVRDEYAVDLPLRKLFENPTVAAIAEVIRLEQQVSARQDSGAVGASASSRTIDRSRLLEMLQRVGDLSEDEVKALLEQKKHPGKNP